MGRVFAVARGRRFCARAFSAALVAHCAAAGFVLEATPAAALGYYARPDGAEPQPRAERKAARRAKAAGQAREAKSAKPQAPAPQHPLFAVISLGGQHITIYNHNGVVERSAVSTGKPGHPTPEGFFTILGRERFHRSNLYSGAPMPFMQRVTWSGVAMHSGVVPGYPASHGCIRLPGGFAAKLWGLTRIGERVVIVPQDVTPSEISHPALPTPKMRAPAEIEARSVSSGWQEASVAGASPALVDPHRYAKQLQAKTAVDAAEATKTAKESAAEVAPKQKEAARANVELKAAEAAANLAKTKAEAAAKALDSATPERREAAEAAKTVADATLVEATTRLEAAKTSAAAKSAEAAEATRRIKETAEAATAAVKADKDARLRTEPMSILVSKKDKRIYVRQGLTPIFDAPATIRDPEKPLGSHLYIATAPEGDGALKWSVLSLPVRGLAEPRANRKRKGQVEDIATAAHAHGVSSPAEALDRIEIDDGVRDRIAERLWLGGSMIVSDQPPSNETSSAGTDLTVKLR
jgi:lipoprotein-anchoring transpeptidase ErfK/SrfK